MRFAIAAAALIGAVSATEYGGYGNYTQPPTYTTEVVTEYTTYCPEATQITYGGVTYTATSETTLTITNCPCTITYPVTSSSYVPPPTTYAPPPVTTYAPPPYVNTTSTYYPPATTAPSSPPVYTPTGSPVPTGAANKAVAASGAGLAAIFGLALAL